MASPDQKTHPAPRAERDSGATRPARAGALPVPRELLTAGMSLDADAEMERQRRMERVKAELRRMLAAGQGEDAIDQAISMMVALERENEHLAWRVVRANRFRFGSNSEKLSREELAQLVLALGGEVPPSGAPAEQDPEVPAPAEPEPVDDPAAASPEPQAPAEAGENDKPPKKPRARVRKMTVAPTVKRNITVVPVPADEACCALCGRPKKVFTHVTHERIRYVPGHIEVDEERRAVAACEHCRKDVSVAPRPAAPAVARKVDASLLAKLAGDKCALGLPLDRQRRELARMGLDAPEKTLQSYWAYTADRLEPVADATRGLVFGKPIVGADDSHLKTLIGEKGGGVFRGHLWCFVGTEARPKSPEIVAYGYTPTWQAGEIADWFSTIDGFIQCDGYAGYAREVEDGDGETTIAVPPDRRLGCAMHIRSKFHAAHLARDRRAAVPLKHFADLYQIEEDCRVRGLDADARTAERRHRSVPILDQFEAWVDALHPQLIPKSPLRRATTYAINQRAFFRRCVEDGRFEIDNGRVERRIRLFAVARRGFLFTGSERGGQRLAVVFTLVDNCLLCGVDPFGYLVDVIDKLERGWPARRLAELIPHNWAANQPRQDPAK
jgi:hypothetical protein